MGDPASVRSDPALKDAPALDRIRAVFWRVYEFSREQPQYFALMFVERSVPRISREYERFAFAREMKQHIIEDLRACIDAGDLPRTVDPQVAMRALMVGMLGVALLNLSDRLLPGENADLLATDVLNLTLAGLRSGVALQSPGSAGCPMDASDPVVDAQAS
jgi:AcrR family transcriptional regulator